MSFIKKSILILSVVSSAIFADFEVIRPTKNFNTSFAIIVDYLTFSKCEEEILNYRNSIEQDGLSAYIVYGDWKNPQEVKDEIVTLYNQKPRLEGVVFVGDIPIPMIRNAQHMTSAFKLDEDKYPWQRSSVPSDRYYDDFDLKFDYLKQDSVETLYHYFSLRSDSPQRIHREIYSARIKPSGNKDNRYEAIQKYLNKVVKNKSEIKKISKAFIFSGHGYHSESLAAWGDERISVKEQFPQLFNVGKRIKFLNHEMSNEMKDELKLELQEDDLDMAIFHAHGDTDMQLLLAYPKSESITQNVEAIKLFLRSKLRTAQRRKQSVEAAKEYYQKEYDIPNSWFEGTFGDSLVKADSLLAYSLDFYIDDVRSIKPTPKFIMFDQCFNGSFHLNEYIAGEYVFGNGNVIAGVGNSVNCLQDKWANEFLGLLNLGVRLGIQHRFINLLESHIIGDPTLRFASDIDVNLNENIILSEMDEEFWEGNLKSKYDEIRSLAVRFLFNLRKESFSNDLTDIYKNDESVNVRLQALKCLAELNDKNFRDILLISVNDSYEFIRRKSVEWMGDVSEPRYIPLLVKLVNTDESSRVSFNGRNSLPLINIEEAGKEMGEFLKNIKIGSDEKIASLIKLNYESTKRTKEGLFEYMQNITSDTLKESKKLSEVRTFRNYKYSEIIDFLLLQLKSPRQSENVRKSIAEALGWFTFHKDKAKIIESCDELIKENKQTGMVLNEIIKTKNRLLTGQNDVMLP